MRVREWNKRGEEHDIREGEKEREYDTTGGKGRRRRHRKDKQPTLVEWEEMNKKMCGALI